MSVRIPLIGVGLAVLIGAAYVFLLYLPLSQEQTAVNEETAQLESQRAALAAEVAELERIRANEPALRAAFDRLDDLIPQDIAQPAALETFQSTAEAAGVEIRSLSFSDAVPADPPALASGDQQLGVITTTMVLEGGYFETIDFLRRLEVDSPRAVLLETVAIAEGEESFPALSTSWTGRLFALIPALPDPAAAPTPAPGGTTPPPPEGAAPPAENEQEAL